MSGPAARTREPGNVPPFGGRVLACHPDGHVTVDDGHRSSRRKADGDGLQVGDVVGWDDDAGSVRRVVRPLRDPFGPDTDASRLVLRGTRTRLQKRSKVLHALRRWFEARDYLEVETPVAVPSPGLDTHLAPFEVPGLPESARWLATSPEYQMKRLVVGGVPRCFQFARCFRADELGARHEPEFTMLEWYRTWAGFEDLLDDTESLVREAILALQPDGRVVCEGRACATDEPFERMTVREAFRRFAPEAGDPIALAGVDEDRYFQTLVTHVEPQLGFDRPVFLTHYPTVHASLARECPHDPTVCERAELYVLGVELSNGFGELTDPREQSARFARDRATRAARGIAEPPVDARFLEALECGMPPTVGNALGVDRLVALACGTPRIADVMAFPLSTR